MALCLVLRQPDELFVCAGWEKPWVEQIVDRIMKGMLKTTEERTQGVVSAGAKADLTGEGRL